MSAAAFQRDLIAKMLAEAADSGIVASGVDGHSIPHFEDAVVCKLYLAGLCPYELFKNVPKVRIGDCGQRHIEKCRDEYLKAVQEGKHPGYDDDLERELSKVIDQVDRTISSRQRALDKPMDDSNSMQQIKQISDMVQEITTLEKEAERLGEEGKVDESMKVLQEIEGIKEQKKKIESELRGGLVEQAASQQQKLRICDVCSASLSIFDSDRRLADHFGGKMHLGYLEVRQKLQQLRESRKSRPLGGGNSGPRRPSDDGRRFDESHGFRNRDEGHRDDRRDDRRDRRYDRDDRRGDRRRRSRSRSPRYDDRRDDRYRRT